jgi:hypothetical protein
MFSAVAVEKCNHALKNTTLTHDRHLIPASALRHGYALQSVQKFGHKSGRLKCSSILSIFIDT